MAEPWFDPMHFGAWYGSIAGGVGGSVIGVFGGIAGSLVSRGVGRNWVLGVMYSIVGLGIVQLCVGTYALLTGQPYGIWYGILMCGFIYTVVVGCLIPVIRRGYRQAEERRLEAAALRKS